MSEGQTLKLPLELFSQGLITSSKDP